MGRANTGAVPGYEFFRYRYWNLTSNTRTLLNMHTHTYRRSRLNRLLWILHRYSKRKSLITPPPAKKRNVRAQNYTLPPHLVNGGETTGYPRATR